MISTASKTTASLSDAKNSKSGFRCQAGCSDEFEFAMRRVHLPRGEAVLQLAKAFGVNDGICSVTHLANTLSISVKFSEVKVNVRMSCDLIGARMTLSINV